MEQNFDFKQVPYGWALCYLEACSRKAECMRYQVCQRLPENRTHDNCVLPTVLRRAECPFYHPIQKMRVAVGFRNIFDRVLAKDIAAMRSDIAAYLGSTTTFYRYRKGEYQLNPRQQQWIRNLFRRYGYTHEVTFDASKEVYVFD